MNTNQDLLLLTLRELGKQKNLLRILRSRCSGCSLDAVFTQQQQQLLSLEWEARALAVQRGMVPPEYSGFISALLLMHRHSSDSGIAWNWSQQNRASLTRFRRAARCYDRNDAVSILCQKSMDFSIRAMGTMEPFL